MLVLYRVQSRFCAGAPQHHHGALYNVALPDRHCGGLSVHNIHDRTHQGGDWRAPVSNAVQGSTTAALLTAPYV